MTPRVHRCRQRLAAVLVELAEADTDEREEIAAAIAELTGPRRSLCELATLDLRDDRRPITTDAGRRG